MASVTLGISSSVLSEAADRTRGDVCREIFLNGARARGCAMAEGTSKREGAPNDDAHGATLFVLSSTGGAGDEEKVDMGSEGGSSCFGCGSKASSLGPISAVVS